MEAGARAMSSGIMLLSAEAGSRTAESYLLLIDMTGKSVLILIARIYNGMSMMKWVPHLPESFLIGREYKVPG
jgi:hypothetical protein